MVYFKIINVHVVFMLMLPLWLLNGCSKAERGPTAPPRIKGPVHQRLGWKAKDYFTDAGVLSLCKAIEEKNLAEVERLVKSGVDVNAKGRANMTPLLWAFPMGEEVFEKMLELGADPNVKLTEKVFPVSMLNKGRSVMSASVTFTDGVLYRQLLYDVPMNNYLKLVLDHGGDPNIEDWSGNTPIFYTKLNDKSHTKERIRILLDAGACFVSTDMAQNGA